MGENYENNLAVIYGVISRELLKDHEAFGETFYTLKVKTLRTSGREDEIVAVISERIVPSINFQVGEKIMLKGQFRSYNSREKNEKHVVLSLFVKDAQNIEEEYHFNEIELCGYVCKEIKYRFTPLGREIADVLLAVNRTYGKSDYIPCIAWGRNAKFCSGLPVGTKLKIKGRIQSRQYVKANNFTEEVRTTYEVSVSQLEVIQDPVTYNEE